MTALTIPVPHRGFSPARAAVGAAVAGTTTTAYLTACSRASQAGCTMIGQRACHAFGLYGPASTAQELGLLAIGLFLGAVTGLAIYLFLGQAHVQDALYRSGAFTLSALITLVPALGLTLILSGPLSRTMPHPAGTITAFAL